MADDSQAPQEVSPMPDSISDHVDSVESLGDSLPIVSAAANTLPSTAVDSLTTTSQSTSPQLVDSTPSFTGSTGRVTVPKKPDKNALPACTIAPVIPIGSNFHLQGTATSAFRPFITHTSIASTHEISSSAQTQTAIPSTPISRRGERSTLPGISNISSLDIKTPTPSPTRPVFLGETSSNNDDYDDGRTTASAPPCTPAPEPYQQPQSPFRNTRQIKKIDLLAMSRSRQSDRAENARRDGRLAPSPRKKDEVLRNSGFTFPAGRSFGAQSTLRLNMNNNSLAAPDTGISPERVGNGTSSTASPNVDVVSVDDQPDPSKCTFSIQFHEFAPAAQMIKCNLCGFVTNNQRFYRRHRRLHSRQYQPNLIHCSLCDYATTQIRKMREHTITNHHLSHPHAFNNPQPGFNPPTVIDSTHRPAVQGQMFIGSGNIFHPVSNRPVNVPVGTAGAPTISNASTLGLPTYIPTPQDHHIQVNNQAGLQHPPRGSAMLGNYAPVTEQQMASYMRSVISNLMSPPRTDPNSSVTSSSLYLQAARNFPEESQPTVPSSNNVPIMEESYNYRRLWNSNTNNSSLNGSQSASGTGIIKVKTEPRAAPINQISRSVRDVSSSTQKDHSTCSPRRQSDTLDSESGMEMSSDDHTGSPQPDVLGCRGDARVSTDTNQTDTTTQAEAAAIGTQCSMPFIKIEFPPHRDPCGFLGRTSRSDRGVQCEIISMSGSHHRHGGRTQSETVSSAGGSAHVETRCYFCGVTFDDEVLYSIHIGCHSHTDPFLCNVCGKQCHNKYGFYSHIMRGHQARPNT